MSPWIRNKRLRLPDLRERPHLLAPHVSCHFPENPPERTVDFPSPSARRWIPSTPSSTTFPRTNHAAPPEHDHGFAVHPRRAPPPAPPHRRQPPFPLVRGPNFALRALVQAKIPFSETCYFLVAASCSWRGAVCLFCVLVDPVMVNPGCIFFVSAPRSRNNCSCIKCFKNKTPFLVF